MSAPLNAGAEPVFHELAWITPFLKAVDDAASLGCAVVLTGDPGSGKTRVCRHLLTRLKDEPAALPAHYHLLSRETEPIRILRDVAYGLSPSAVPSEWRFHVLSHTISALAKELKDRGVRLLILDRADKAPDAFFEDLFQVLEIMRDQKHLCGLLLTGSDDPASWLNRVGPRSGIVLRHQAIPRLGPRQVCMLLAGWCWGFDRLEAALQAEDPASIAPAVRLGDGVCRGNLQLVLKLARLKNLHFPADEINPALIDLLAEEMRPPLAFAPPETQPELSLK